MLLGRAMGKTVVANAALKSDVEQHAAYDASWVDRLTDRVRALPVPAWAVYLLVALSLVLLRAVAGWSDGSYPVGTFFRIHLLDGLTSVYLLLILHYLDDRAKASLAAFRPVLNVDAEGYTKLRYALSTMPARPAFFVSLLGLAFGLSYYPFLMSATDLISYKYLTSPLAAVVDVGISGILWTLNSAFAYHTFHQLRLVSLIYSKHTNVSIFDSGPLYALSRIGATTSVSLLALIYVYYEFYNNGQVNTSAVNYVLASLFILIALATFVWPLFGAHRLLQDEKERCKGEISRHIEATAAELYSRTEGKVYAEMGGINSTIDGLVKVQGIVSKASTWPWDPEALRAVVTALLLPVVIWVITRLLERFGI